MAEPVCKISAKFDNILEIINEIASLQTYTLFDDDDMLLVERNDVVEVLKRHVVTEVEK